MLGYDDSKGDGGLLFEAANTGRWSWARLSTRGKSLCAGSALVASLVILGLTLSGSQNEAAVAGASPIIAAEAGCTNGGWAQCGGVGFAGSTCCPDAHSCTARSSDFSQCVPDCT